MKESKFYKPAKESKHLWLSKLLLSIIFLLLSLILTNLNPKFREKFQEQVLNKNIRFVDINKLYEKYVGVLNKNDVKEELTFNEQSSFQKIEKVGNSFKVMMEPMEMVSALKSGIIVYIGEMEELGNTIIVQGNDGVDIWYSNVGEITKSLYDYISAGTDLGISSDGYVYITLKKDEQYLDYEEYIREI